MYHAIDEITITDTACCLVDQFEDLSILLLPIQAWLSRVHRTGIEVVLLKHQGGKLVIVEVKLTLLIQGGLAR